jgi:predicted PurR-regulated permease PerM
MMLIAFFFLAADGERFVAWLERVSPLRPGQTTELLREFRKTSVALIGSSLATAGLQALVALIGYLIARAPHPLFVAMLTFCCAFIPAIGAASVCVVLAIILFAQGYTYTGIFLALWGVGVVGLVDNIVKPLLVRRGMELHGGVVFFALIGGFAAFGPVGVLVGPLAVAFFLALLRISHVESSQET